MFAIYLTVPQLVELCVQFQSVIRDSLERCDYGRALDLAGKCLESLDDSIADAKLIDQRSAIRLWRAEQMVALQRWDVASEELDGLLCRASFITEKTLLIRAWVLAAQIHGVYGEQEQAWEALERSRQSDPDEQFRELRELEQARLLVKSGELTRALELLPTGLGAEHNIERGGVLFRLQRFEEAQAAWRPVADAREGGRCAAEACRLLGLLHQARAESHLALAYFERSLRLSWESQLWIAVAKCYEGLGQICSDLGKVSEALHFTLKAERLSRRLGAESELAVVYGRLGNLCMKLGDYSRAIRFHQLDVDLCHRFGNFRALAYALSSLAHSYRAQGSHQLAYELFSKSLDQFLQLGERGPILRLYIERGRTLLERNLLEEASTDLRSASLMLGQEGALGDSAQIQVLSARLERLRNHPERALAELDLAFVGLAQLAKDHPLRCEAWREKGYLCLSRGDLEQAKEAFGSATVLARRGEQQAIWQECLEQLERLSELAGAEVVLEGLQRSQRESGELRLGGQVGAI